MKKNNVFKTLLDILVFIFLIGTISTIIFIIRVGRFTINHVIIDVENWNLFFWFIAVVSLLTYIIFLRGLYFLRKIAKIVSVQYFSDINISNSKKVGIHFLLSGILYFFIIVILWINRLIDLGQFEIGTDFDIIVPLTLMIIGVFFIIHARNLLLAKSFKEENELTV